MPAPKVEIRTGRRLLPDPACSTIGLNRDPFAVHAPFKRGNGIDTIVASANLPADNGCEIVTSSKIVSP